MGEMWRTLLKYFVATAAIILTTGSLIVLGFWFRAFSPELYTSSLKESGIYKQTSIVIQDYAVYSLSTFGQEELAKVFGFALETIEEGREEEGKTTLGDETKSAIASGVGVFLGTLIEEQTQKLVSYAAEQIQLEQTLEEAVETAISFGVKWEGVACTILAPATAKLECSLISGVPTGLRMEHPYIIASFNGQDF